MTDHTVISPALSELKTGDRMPDRTIYVGISPDTRQPLYAAPSDASMRMNFKQAAKYAKLLEVGDKKDFRVPSKAELELLFLNQEKGALKETFNSACIDYWSSSKPVFFLGNGQRFSDGVVNEFGNSKPLSVRCVR